jgi:formate dehydrogenase subunit delta
MQEIDSLVKMVNQIADNLDFHDDAVERVADHLQRFWAPSMREKITEHEANGGSGLNPSAQAAVRRLAGTR